MLGVVKRFDSAQAPGCLFFNKSKPLKANRHNPQNIMASIHKNQKSKFWQASFRDATGRLKARSTGIEHSPLALPGETPADTRRRKVENERAARLMATEFEEALRGRRTEAQMRKVFEDVSSAVQRTPMKFETCRGWLETWLRREKNSLAAGTYNRYAGTVAAFLRCLENSGRGDVMLNEIRSDDVEEFKAARIAAGIKDSTVRADIKSLNVPFAQAVKTGKIISNPVAAVELPRRISQERGAFSTTEIEALLKEAADSEPEFATAIYLAAFAGLRLGDATSLTWEAVDTCSKTLKLTPQKTAAMGRKLEVPMHPRLEAHLLALPMAAAPDAPLCPTLAKLKPGGRSGLSKRFLAIMRRAGIEQQTTAGAGEGRTFNARTFHSLRHSFITRLQAAEVAPDLRMKLAGHSDERTHAGYTHTEVETLRKAIEKI